MHGLIDGSTILITGASSVEARAGAVDVLINNAGIGDQALLEQADWQRIRRVLEVNVFAVAQLTQRLIAPMVRRKHGGILNMSSGAGLAWMPGAATYTGSKHFVTAFTETLRAELAGTGLVVTQVCPGPVATEFDTAAGISGLQGGPPNVFKISAVQCAREAIAGFERGKAMVFPGWPYRCLMLLQGFAPRSLQRYVAVRSARRLRRASSAAHTHK